jgi:hypothetical protein
MENAARMEGGTIAPTSPGDSTPAKKERMMELSVSYDPADKPTPQMLAIWQAITNVRKHDLDANRPDGPPERRAASV